MLITLIEDLSSEKEVVIKDKQPLKKLLIGKHTKGNPDEEIDKFINDAKSKISQFIIKKF